MACLVLNLARRVRDRDAKGAIKVVVVWCHRVFRLATRQNTANVHRTSWLDLKSNISCLAGVVE
jgi:hypothetical protein